MVIVAQQVQESVSDQQGNFIGNGVAADLGVFGGDLWTNDDIAQQPLSRLLLGAGAQFVHGKAHDVGGAVQAHPFLVQLTHRIVVNKDHGKFGFGRDVEVLVEVFAKIDHTLQ